MDRPAEPMHKLFANIENEDDEALAPYLELKQQIQRIVRTIFDIFPNHL